MTIGVLDTPIGPLCVVTNDLGVARVDFGTNSRVELPAGTGSATAAMHLEQATVELTEFFAGQRQHFSVAIDRTERRGFRVDVLAALETVPFGRTVSYGELAAMAGRPKAFRAVGTTMGQNPIAVIVPCHRVLRAGGEIGHYGGGVAAKQWLLDREGFQRSAP